MRLEVPLLYSIPPLCETNIRQNYLFLIDMVWNWATSKHQVSLRCGHTTCYLYRLKENMLAQQYHSEKNSEYPAVNVQHREIYRSCLFSY